MTSKLNTLLRVSLRCVHLRGEVCPKLHRRSSLKLAQSSPITSYYGRFYSTAEGSSTTSKSEPPANEEQPIENPESESKEIKELEELKASQLKLAETLKATEDKYMRALAETENVRQRMRKQVDDAKQFGIQSFCKDLLNVADTLRLASDNIPAEQLENETVKNMFDGLKLTESQLLQVFNQHGVKICNPEGEKFDPNFHEAVFQQPIPEKDPGTIFVVTKPGYTLNDRVLRPAMVGVVQTP